ncbi:MAG: GNAT family N-acetyltransferase [Psychromonas sp.]
MNKTAVMNQYNHYERININAFSGKKIATTKLVKFVSNNDYGSYISYFEMKPNDAVDQIQKEVKYFSELGLSFEWKTYNTDSPVNIAQILIDNGFEEADTESFMVLDLASVSEPYFDDNEIVEVSDSQGIRDAISVQQQVWDGDFEWQYNYLLGLKTQSPKSISIYVVYVDGKPVTSAWIIFNLDSPFASIWGGSTVEKYRGRGYYCKLLNKRIAEAKSRGKKFLSIDASDMSKGIVEKHGFKLIAKTVGYVYENNIS